MSVFDRAIGGSNTPAGIRLVVNDVVYAGWLSAEVERCLDEFAPRFALRYLDKWGPNVKPWPIRKGAACRVLYDDEVLIDGFVNRSRMHVAGETWELSCDGRSKTGDLVDCSATHKTGHWQNATATQIIKDLLAPYSLTVKSALPDFEIFPRFALEQGETVHAAIDRICKVRGLLPVTTPEGNVFLADYSIASAPIELEVRTAIDRTLDENDQDQYSEYLLKAVGVGSPQEAFAQAAIIDPNVARFRPLVVQGDAPANTAQAKTRAQWECNVRAGRSERLHYTMPSALCSNGDTYNAGMFFRVADDVLGVDETMIVTRAVLRAAEREQVTLVELARPESFAQLPYPRKKLTGVTKRGKPIVHKIPRK